MRIHDRISPPAEPPQAAALRGEPPGDAAASPIYLRLSVTTACNLACRYCRPVAECAGTDEESRPAPSSRSQLNDDELLDLVGRIHDVAPIRKLRFTGGEPLLRPGLTALVTRFGRSFPGSKLCLTTNGTLLSEHARPLRAAGIEAVNISLDAATEERFQALARHSGLQKVLAGIAAAREAGFARLKLNTVLMRSHNGDQLTHLIRIAAHHSLEIRFVELMPIGVGAASFANEYLPADEALATIHRTFPSLRPIAPTATAPRRFEVDVDGRALTIGFITSVSQHFCHGCDRIRLDSRGRLFTCLRAAGGLDLYELVRSNDPGALRTALSTALRNKQPPQAGWPRRSMVNVGG